MRTGIKIIALWIVLVLVSAVLANLIVWMLDGVTRKKYEKDGMDEPRSMQIDDQVSSCVMGIHMLERRIDMHELRLEDIEDKVFGTNFNMEAGND